MEHGVCVLLVFKMRFEQVLLLGTPLAAALSTDLTQYVQILYAHPRFPPSCRTPTTDAL